MKLIPLISAFCFLAGAAFAQSISIEDLQKQIDAELATSNQYADLLNNPDPAQSLAAMKVMLRSGDPILLDLALNYGLYSPNAEVQYLAVKGFLDSGPELEIQFDGRKANTDIFTKIMKSHFFSAVASDMSGTWVVHIGPFNAEKNCYLKAEAGSTCLMRHSKNSTMIYVSGQWSRIHLTDNGTFEGLITVFKLGGLPAQIAF